MKRTWLRLLACSSAASIVLGASMPAATRPKYGGTLRISMHSAINTFDPNVHDDVRDNAAGRLMRLVFDTLVTQDDMATLQPSLARAWSSDATFHRWQFWLRHDVRFHDGELLTPELAATALANEVSGCHAHPLGESVVLECDAAHPALAAMMASPSASIVRRSGSGRLEGTGPFLLSEWQPGRRAVFTAFQDSWAGRPYVDRIEVTMAQDYRDQALALQLGRADLVEVAPEQGIGGARLSMASASELVALVFSPASSAVADERVRSAFSLAIDRGTIANVLLQRQAEPAGGILPNWISGYEFLFHAEHDEAQARQLRTDARASAPLSLAVTSGDSQLRLIAERIALGARDAGFAVQFTSDTQRADIVLIGTSLDSTDPGAALIKVAADLRRPMPDFHDDTLDSAFRAERAMLAGSWVVPVVHTSRTWALSARVRNWAERHDGVWSLDNAWLDTSDGAGDTRR